MKCKQGLVLFLVVALCVSLFVLAPVPVTRAAVSVSVGPVLYGTVTAGNYYVAGVHIKASFDTTMTFNNMVDNTYSQGITNWSGYGMFNGHSIDVSQFCFRWSSVYGGSDLSWGGVPQHYGFSFFVPNSYGPNDGTSDTWSAHLSFNYNYNGNVWNVSLNTSGSGIVSSGQSWAPLSVSISGPSAVDTTVGGLWTATVTGGTVPYLYLWQWGMEAPYWSGAEVTGSVAYNTTELSHVFSSGSWILQCTVTDADDIVAVDSFVVNASLVVGAYHVYLRRSGPQGQYVDMWVVDSGGSPVTISSSAGSQWGAFGTIPVNGDGFQWLPLDNEASATTEVLPGFSAGYIWRFNLRSIVDLIPYYPGADFWLSSSVHLAVSGLDLPIMHHFLSILQLPHEAFYDETGAAFDSEKPPVEAEPEVPVAMKWLWDWIYKIFAYLFVPSTAQVQGLAKSISDSSFNPFQGVSWPEGISSIVLLRGEDIGMASDFSIPLEDNAVFATIRLGMKFMISFSIVMLILAVW